MIGEKDMLFICYPKCSTCQKAKKWLDENSIERLDIKLQLLKERLSEKPIVTLSYFKPDEKKEGGSYLTVTGTVKKIDEYEHRIIMDDGTSVLISDLVAVEGHIFNESVEFI